MEDGPIVDPPRDEVEREEHDIAPLLGLLFEVRRGSAS